MLKDIRWLIASARGYGRLYILSLLFTIGSGVIGLADPLIIKWVIDKVIPARDVGLLVVAGGAFVIAYAFRVLLGIQGGNMGMQAAQRHTVRLRFKVLRRLQGQSSAYHDNISPGEFLFRLEQDVEQIGQAGDELFSSSFRSSIFLVLNLAAMFILNPRLAIIVLPLIPAFAFIRYRYYRLAGRLSESVQSTCAERSSFLQQQLAAVTESQLLRNERFQAGHFLSLARRAMGGHLTRRKVEMLYSGLSVLVMGGGVGGMLIAGGEQVITGILTVGGLVAFWGYLMRLFDPIAGLIELDTKLQRTRASVHRVRELLDARTAVENPVPALNLMSRKPASVEFDNVSFAYEDGRVGVEGLSFALEAGQKVAIVGKTGSGKSTLTKLIVRLYDVHQGTIEVDGLDIRRLALASLRSSVLLIPQQPALFHGSFRDNLVCGRSNTTTREIEEVIGLAELDPVLCTLPGGWDEQLGPRSTKLSGGERQRLALARALLRKPRLLIMDEATSALDCVTEERVLENLDALRDRMTLLFVTHNPIVMSWVDRVLMMVGGCLVDQGSHLQLTLESRIYQDICEDQPIVQRNAPQPLLSTIC